MPQHKKPKNTPKNLFCSFFTRRIHPSWIIFAATLGIVGGIIFTIATRLCLFPNWLWLICGILLIACAFLHPTYALLILPLIGGFFIAQYRASFDLAGQDYLNQFIDQEITITGTIAEDPDLTEEKTAIRLKELCLGNHCQTDNSTDNQPNSQTDTSTNNSDTASTASTLSTTLAPTLSGTLYVQLSRTDSLQRSDRITLTGELSSGFGTFAGTMFRPTVEAVSRDLSADPLLAIRNQFAAGVKTFITEPEVDLGLGYLLGVRNSLPEDLNSALKTIGLTHIVVASGANLAILVDFARRWLGKISRVLAFVGATLLVLAFVGMVGLTASMTRAALVTLLSLIAWFVGRKFKPARLLLIVAAVTLLYNPMYLLDLGWLLSFAAFAGILIVGPRLTRFLYGDRSPNPIMAVALETLSANLLCLPLLLYTFGQISLISLVANLIIVPTIPAVMFLILLTGLTANFSLFAAAFARLATLLLAFHLYIIDLLGKQTIFLIQISINDWRVFLLYIPVVLILSISEICQQLKLHRKRQKLQQQLQAHQLKTPLLALPPP